MSTTLLRATAAAREPASASRIEQAVAAEATLEGRLRAVAALIPPRVAFSTSMGLEDQAILHALAQTGLDVDVFTLDTGRLFQETLDVIDESVRRYGVDIRLVAPEAAEVESLVARDGVLGLRSSIEARKACCGIRKVRPLRKALTGANGWITGMRRAQSSERSNAPFAEHDAEHGLVKINPIADWDDETLDAYLKANDVPVNALHARGFPSIGCQPCTRAILPGEDIRAGRWWWENEDGKECGLHNRPALKGVAA